MLVLFGANGRTGLAILREARRRGMEVRPVVRDDRDISRIKGLADVRSLSYADPRHLDAVRAVMGGARHVISAIDPRATGPGAPVYPREATANIARGAAEAGAEGLIHLSVMGAYRWSPLEANTHSFELDTGIRDVEGPWFILRFSAWLDEVVEGHVRPPDGGAPHPLPRHSRYSPVSRQDGARIALNMIPRMVPGRIQNAGGPQTFFTPELDRLIAPHRAQGGRRARTRCMSLPPGDVSVETDTTRATAGWLPGDTLAALLEEGEAADEPPPRPTVYPQGDPPPHPADSRSGGRVLAGAGEDLRRVLHAQLVADLPRVGVHLEHPRLDFQAAVAGRRHVRAHDGEVPEMSGVRVRTPEGALVYEGDVDLLRDKLADEFRCWWAGAGLPEDLWESLDMGVRRRLSTDPHFARDPLVIAFLKQNPRVN